MKQMISDSDLKAWEICAVESSTSKTAQEAPGKPLQVRSIDVDIPGRGRTLRIERVVFDFNGTLAVDGKLIRGVSERLKHLATMVNVVVMTADTFGTAQRTFKYLPVTVRIVNNGDEKLDYIKSVGAGTVAAVGNGTNDIQMLSVAALGIAVLGTEGIFTELLRVSTIAVRDINDAIDLLLKPKRLVATLRR